LRTITGVTADIKANIASKVNPGTPVSTGSDERETTSVVEGVVGTVPVVGGVVVVGIVPVIVIVPD
jgi:hypothetical protein